MKKITHEWYIKSTTLNDEREPDEKVPAEFVHKYISDETLAWFERLGGTETVNKTRAGAITVTSVSPDRTQIRTTVFTPLVGEVGS